MCGQSVERLVKGVESVLPLMEFMTMHKAGFGYTMRRLCEIVVDRPR